MFYNKKYLSYSYVLITVEKQNLSSVILRFQSNKKNIVGYNIGLYIGLQ